MRVRVCLSHLNLDLAALCFPEIFLHMKLYFISQISGFLLT